MTTGLAEKLEADGQSHLRAPLFASLIQGLEDERRHVVLDLGRARESTIELFGQFRCRLDIVDLPRALEQIDAAETSDEIKAIVRRLLPVAGADGAELVLCWNLLNYLGREAVGAVMQVLAERLRAGARIHALIEYSARDMPAKPPSISPSVSDNSLAMQVDTGPTRPAPRYSPTELAKLMPGLESERAMLLGNGMQEYLFRYSGPG